MLLTKIERVLKRHLFEGSSDGMKGLASDIRNALNKYKSTINIKRRDVLAASIVASDLVSTDDNTAKPEITNGSNAYDKAERHNVFRLTAIGIRKDIEDGITKIVGKDTTNPILRTTDDSDLKDVDEYHIHQLFTSITERKEIP